MFKTGITRSLHEIPSTCLPWKLAIQITGMGNSWIMETLEYNGKCWATQTMGVTTGFAHGKVCCHSNKVQQTALKTPKEKKNIITLQMYFQEPLLTVFMGVESWLQCTEADRIPVRAAVGHGVPPPLKSAGGTDLWYAEHIRVIVNEI